MLFALKLFSKVTKLPEEVENTFSLSIYYYLFVCFPVVDNIWLELGEPT